MTPQPQPPASCPPAPTGANVQPGRQPAPLAHASAEGSPPHPASRDEIAEPAGGRRVAMLLLVTAAYAASFAAWTLVGALAPIFAATWALSATQVGWLVAVPVAVGALARLPIGMLADRFGARGVLCALVLVQMAAAMMMSDATDYTGLLVIAALLGLGGGTFAAGAQFVGRWFPRGTAGLAFGVFGLGNAGAALTAGLAPVLWDLGGSRAVAGVYAAALAVMAIAFYGFARVPAGLPLAHARDLRGALRTAGAWQLSFLYVISFGGFLALSVHLATVLVDVYALSPAQAGRHVAAFAVIGTLARPVGGLLSDRWGGRRLLHGVFPLVTVLALALAMEPAHLTGTTIILLLGVMLGLGNGAVTQLVAEQFPTAVGTVNGLVGAVGSLGGLLLPVAQGIGQDLTGSYVFGFLLLAVLAQGGFLVNIFRRSR